MGPYAFRDHTLRTGIPTKMLPNTCKKGRESPYSEIVCRVCATKAVLCHAKITHMVDANPGVPQHHVDACDDRGRREGWIAIAQIFCEVSVNRTVNSSLGIKKTNLVGSPLRTPTASPWFLGVPATSEPPSRYSRVICRGGGNSTPNIG